MWRFEAQTRSFDAREKGPKNTKKVGILYSHHIEVRAVALAWEGKEAVALRERVPSLAISNCQW